MFIYMHDSSNRCCGGQKIYAYILLLKIWDHCIYLLFVRQEHLV